MKATRIALFPMFLAIVQGCETSRPLGEQERERVSLADEVALTLDTLHHAAATADEATYFALFAPEAVFLGTDATERWTLEEFKAFALPYFERESAWVYTVIERHADWAPNGDFAWFDERLTNARLGETRGSGALRKVNDRWRIVQYNLTIPIPNELADQVADQIRSWQSQHNDLN